MKAKFEPGKKYYEIWCDVDELGRCFWRHEAYECVRRTENFVWLKDKNGTVKRSQIKIELNWDNNEITYTKFNGIQCNVRANMIIDQYHPEGRI